MKAQKTGSGKIVRDKLMQTAKAKKIAYYRIMSKTELIEVLKPGITAKRIAEIQKTAVKRWQSGWKFRKPAKQK